MCNQKPKVEVDKFFGGFLPITSDIFIHSEKNHFFLLRVAAGWKERQNRAMRRVSAVLSTPGVGTHGRELPARFEDLR